MSVLEFWKWDLDWVEWLLVSIMIFIIVLGALAIIGIVISCAHGFVAMIPSGKTFIPVIIPSSSSGDSGC